MNIRNVKKHQPDFDLSLNISRSFLRSSLAAAVLSSALAWSPLVSAQSRHIELNDMAKIVSVADPQISPDGKTIVVVVSRINLEQDRSDRELVQVDVATGGQHADPKGTRRPTHRVRS